MKDLPKRIEALEQRVQALEQKALPQRKTIAKGRECPRCGAELTVLSESKDPLMGAVGIKLHKLACDTCRFTTERQFAPGDGYL